jgi:hypothetical protein
LKEKFDKGDATGVGICAMTQRPATFGRTTSSGAGVLSISLIGLILVLRDGCGPPF